MDDLEIGDVVTVTRPPLYEPFVGVVVEPLDTKEELAATLRDQFAMAALTGLLSNSGGVVQANNIYGTGYVNSGDGSSDVAAWSYEIADAMLKER